MTRRPRRVSVGGNRFHPEVPEGSVYVGRSAPYLRRSEYANPYTVARYGRDEALRLFVEEHLAQNLALVDRGRRLLAGYDLACWCPLPPPRQTDHCHAAIWLHLTNPDDYRRELAADARHYPAIRRILDDTPPETTP